MMQWLIFRIKFIFDSSYFKFLLSWLEISPYKEHVKWAQKTRNILNKFTIIHLSKNMYYIHKHIKQLALQHYVTCDNHVD